MHAHWLPSRGGLVSAALLLALVVGGCGLSDYEERMKETQARALYLEEASKLLDGPVEVPTRQDGDKSVAVANVFFRPPRGIQRTPDPTPRNNLYAYLPGTTATGGSAAVASGVFYQVQLGFGGTTDKDFAANVLRNFPASGQASERRTLHPPGRAELVYDSTDFDSDQMSYSVNIYQGSQTQVAVVFSVVRGQRDRARPALLLSLESLGVDAEANRLREAFKNPSPWGLRQTAK